MPTHLVNLDALIRREDFEARTGDAMQSRRLSDQIKIEDLERTYFHLLRKPDFQRETSSWDPERIVDFVKSFLDGHLIPAVIMWWSNLNGTVFVIDGAHRLSALMAWVHDDYGDGKVSKDFWGFSISNEQMRLAKLTRECVEREVGAYQRLKYIAQHPDESPSVASLLRARNMATFKIDLQWVEGNAETAENSFFKINGSASMIDPTELGILKARRKPNAIATRALMNSGSGHKYWSDFPTQTKNEIEDIAKTICESLFKPILESPVKTLDLPIAGQAYSADAFKMIFDLINLVNEVTPGMWQESSKGGKKSGKGRRKAGASLGKLLDDDMDGSVTVSYLRNVKKAASLISGSYPGSLGLHPIVYFYGTTGRFQPTAFLATVKYVLELKDRDLFESFTDVREVFEEYLISHRFFVSAIGHGYGSRTRPIEALLAMYRAIFKEVKSGKRDHQDITTALLQNPQLHVLKSAAERADRDTTTRKRFSKDEKSEAFLREAHDSPIRCAICGARLHLKSISHDHITRVQDGGKGDAGNAQPTHPYCNTGYKESHVAKARATLA